MNKSRGKDSAEKWNVQTRQKEAEEQGLSLLLASTGKMGCLNAPGLPPPAASHFRK